NPSSPNQIAATCTQSTSHRDLDINNIRCPIMINGDMWWDLNSAQYEVPKDQKKYSLFAGALWIGGLDQSGNLKMADQTYRQSGNDFWPGPIETGTSIGNNVCTEYDRHWRVTREEVETFANSYKQGNTPISNPSKDIQEWPGNGDTTTGQTKFLAPFHDHYGDGIYDPQEGDYPGYNLNQDPADPDTNNLSGEYLLGDQTIWW